MRSLKALFVSIFDQLAILTMLGILTLIITVLAYVSPSHGGVSRKVLVLCFVIAIIGIIATVCRMRMVYRMNRARAVLSGRLAEGQRVLLAMRSSMPVPTQAQKDEAGGWLQQVEVDIGRYLDESYLRRFQFQVSLESPSNPLSLKVESALESIGKFLSEPWVS